MQKWLKMDRSNFKLCDNCELGERMVGLYKSCANCKETFYCSRDCQKKHWNNGHKVVCKK